MVSVCMATYNGERFIEEQLVSILGQLGTGDEVVISDDGSTDQTAEIVRSLHDSRLKIVSSGQRSGIALNFQNALQKARGQLIFLADQDDIWLPHKIEKLSSRLQTNVVATSDCQFVDANKNVVLESYYSRRQARPGIIHNLIRNTYVGCCMAFRRELLTLALPFPNKVPMHDWWIGLCGEMAGRVEFLPEVLVLHRIHQDNASATSGVSPFTRRTQILWRLRMIVALSHRLIGSDVFQKQKSHCNHES